jgi:AraC-like DNA-binding protein
MEFEWNQLIECFTTSSFHVQGVYRYHIAAGKQGKQSTAPYPGFIFPLGGKAQFDFNGTSYRAETQKVIHGGADMKLDKKVIGNTELQYISVLYDIKQNSTDSIYLPDVHFELEYGQSLRLKGLMNQLWKVSHMPGAIPAFQKETFFRCMLEEMFLCVENQARDSDKGVFSKISAYIQDNYADEIPISELAERYEMNTNRLYYIFYKYAGMGPGDYLIAYRLNRAKELLLTTDSAIHKISNEVGYCDPLYFSRSFKKHFGFPPSEMRKKFRNNP